ncbi:MAG: hypothetical protein IKV17_06675 [Bacteroidaceae bacterium]|nr:hypothetical protein [Bacteroidaceae bacterium]
MKKMMIIAAMVSVMLIPAQVFAQGNKNDRGDRKVRIEKQREDKKKENFKGDFGKGNNKDLVKKNDKKAPKIDKKKPAPKVVVKEKAPKVIIKEKAPKVIVKEKPVVVHKPAPQPVIVDCCDHNDNDAVNAAAIAVGVIGLAALLAN